MSSLARDVAQARSRRLFRSRVLPILLQIINWNAARHAERMLSRLACIRHSQIRTPAAKRPVYKTLQYHFHLSAADLARFPKRETPKVVRSKSKPPYLHPHLRVQGAPADPNSPGSTNHKMRRLQHHERDKFSQEEKKRAVINRMRRLLWLDVLEMVIFILLIITFGVLSLSST